MRRGSTWSSLLSPLPTEVTSPTRSRGLPRSLHLIVVAALVARLLVALLTDHVNQADEIFQYLEQGHRFVFGYGFVPWEYRFGLRSWIVPLFVSGWLYGFKLLGLDDPAFYIPAIRGIACVLSVSLIYAGYVVVRGIASHRAGTMAALCLGSWYELIYYAQKTTPEILALYCLVGALACSGFRAIPKRPVAFGLLVGSGVMLRLQDAPMAMVLAALVVTTWRRRELVRAALAASVVVLAGGLLDAYTWGGLFASYLQNLLLNTGNGFSSMFGRRPALYYVAVLWIGSAGVILAGLAFGWLQPRRTWPLMASAWAVLFGHMMIPHKEPRYVFLVVPLVMLATVALLRPPFDAWYAALLTVCSVLGWSYLLPLESKLYARPLLSRHESLVAYRRLGRDPELHAVLDLYNEVATTGGYYYLHRRVPVFVARDEDPHGLSRGELLARVSHVVCRTSEDRIPGFDTVFRAGALEIRKRTRPLASYPPFGFDPQEFILVGIDGAFKPRVRPRF